MDDRIYSIKISPEVINGDVFKVNLFESYSDTEQVAVCCDIETHEIIRYVTGSTYVYSSMTQILSGNTDGTSLLTGLTIPVLLTENIVDIGYYSVFDGMVLQKDVMTNFLFSANTSFPYMYYFYNTSDTEFKKYLSFSSYQIDWGDNTSFQVVTSTSPNYYSHVYSQSGEYTITMSGVTPWGINIIQKTITVPFVNVTITNPNGTAYFIPVGGNWSATPISYDFIFSGDESCNDYEEELSLIDVPFIVSGYTKSSINELEVYGNKLALFSGKYKIGVPVSGETGSVGTFWGPSQDGLYTAYTINGTNYYDYADGKTLFIIESSGITSDMVICSALTKNEVLMNVIDEAEVQTNIFVERGKLSALERIIRLNEVDNLGDLEKYGYKFYKF